MAYDYDLVVIGAGSAGLAAAKQAAAYGAKVAIVEREQLGGVCINRGCVPKKLMVYAADFAQAFADAPHYGWSIESVQFNWQQFVENRNREIDRIHQSQRQALTDAGIDLIMGQASFLEAHAVEIDSRKVTADKFLIAVGGMPIKPKIPGIEQALTSREMFGLRSLPSRLGILGGGYIGVEFGSTLRALGATVTLMNQEDCILTGFDQDLSQTVYQGLTQRGIRILCNTTAKEIRQSANGLQMVLEGDCSETLEVDAILCATGRTPNLEALNLEQAGVELEGKAIAVDEYSRTSQANIYAAGDCTNRLPLTPAVRAEGRAFADTVFGNQPYKLDYASVPSAVFARPEAATVGMTEAQARERYGAEAIDCDRIEFRSLYDRLSESPKPALFKRVFLRQSGEILGIHLVGEQSAEIIQGMVLALKQGISKQDIDHTLGIHPTSAEEFFE
ncbi:glutathione-disulfide reductase [Phormidium tenue FACHB-886]|nr:glutathione-disulfide reductase [Phormidium tenue FACHB-886]